MNNYLINHVKVTKRNFIKILTSMSGDKSYLKYLKGGYSIPEMKVKVDNLTFEATKKVKNETNKVNSPVFHYYFNRGEIKKVKEILEKDWGLTDSDIIFFDKNGVCLKEGDVLKNEKTGRLTEIHIFDDRIMCFKEVNGRYYKLLDESRKTCKEDLRLAENFVMLTDWVKV